MTTPPDPIRARFIEWRREHYGNDPHSTLPNWNDVLAAYRAASSDVGGLERAVVDEADRYVGNDDALFRTDKQFGESYIPLMKAVMALRAQRRPVDHLQAAMDLLAKIEPYPGGPLEQAREHLAAAIKERGV